MIWNEVLTLLMSKEATIIVFADDLGMVEATIQPQAVKMYAIKTEINMGQLDLTEKKTEPVLFTNGRKMNTTTICLGDHIITSMTVIK